MELFHVHYDLDIPTGWFVFASSSKEAIAFYAEHDDVPSAPLHATLFHGEVERHLDHFDPTIRFATIRELVELGYREEDVTPAPGYVRNPLAPAQRQSAGG